MHLCQFTSRSNPRSGHREFMLSRFPHLSSKMLWYNIVQCSNKGLSFIFSGGKLVYLYTKKRGSVPKCGDCKKKLQGVRIYTVQNLKNKDSNQWTTTAMFDWIFCIVSSFLQFVQGNLNSYQSLKRQFHVPMEVLVVPNVSEKGGYVFFVFRSSLFCLIFGKNPEKPI